MKVDTEISANETTLTLILKSRDDLERAIPWLPSMRVLFPYPEPPADPVPGSSENMGSAAPAPNAHSALPQQSGDNNG